MDNRILEIYQKLEEIKDLLDDVIQSNTMGDVPSHIGLCNYDKLCILQICPFREEKKHIGQLRKELADVLFYFPGAL